MIDYIFKIIKKHIELNNKLLLKKIGSEQNIEKN
jgi:hypothetical protein